MLFEIERELKKKIEKGTINYCIPKLFAYEDLSFTKIADGKRVFVNPYEFYAGAIRRVFEYKLNDDDNTNNIENTSRWLKKATVFQLSLKEDLRYNHKGFWIPDGRKTFDHHEKGSFLKAIAILPFIREMGYDTLLITDNIDNLFEFSDGLIDAISPNSQFEAFTEAARLLKMKVITKLDVTSLKEKKFLDFLEKKILFLSEIYLLDGVVLELDSDIELNPLSTLIGRIKKFNPLFSFVFSSDKHESLKSVKKLGFQAVYLDMHSQINDAHEENDSWLSRVRTRSDALPLMCAFNKSLPSSDEKIPDLKLTIFACFFDSGYIPCVTPAFILKGDWNDVNYEFFDFMKKLCSMRNRYREFISENREYEGVLTDSESIIGRVYKNPIEDSALVMLVNTDRRKEHWISLDVHSLGLNSYHRIKRKLESFEEVMTYIEVEDGYVHVPLKANEGTLLTIR